MTSSTGSPPIKVVKIPYRFLRVANFAPLDDWGYYEGRPTPPLSPLMPFNTVPWFHRKWMFDKIQPPVYSTGNMHGFGSLLHLRSKFVYGTPINKPSLVKDFHIIAVRKQIEQLFAPKFAAHLVVTINDTMHIPPCFWIRHGRYQKSWWIGDGTGGEILFMGHEHWFRDGTPSGKLHAHMELSIQNSALKNWGGSVSGLDPGQDFRKSYGNYYILNIRYEWEVEERWRKMVLEDWSTIRQDYMSIAPNFLMPHFGGWHMILEPGVSETGRAIGFAIDMGQMWQPATHAQGGASYYEVYPGYYRVTKYLVRPGVYGYTGPEYTSCSRPYKEARMHWGSGGGSTKLAGAVQIENPVFKNIEGFNCGILDRTMTEISPNDSPEFPGDITRPGAIEREDGTHGAIYHVSENKFPKANCTASIKYKKFGSTIEITPLELSIEGNAGGVGYTHVAHCIGAKLTPRCYVTIMDLNGRIYKDIIIKDIEVYYA